MHLGLGGGGARRLDCPLVVVVGSHISVARVVVHALAVGLAGMGGGAWLVVHAIEVVEWGACTHVLHRLAIGTRVPVALCGTGTADLRRYTVH